MTVGIAMIARNGAKTMRRALDPFKGQVDEVAIVLGGKSTDNTVTIARRYTNKVLPFTGPVDNDGRLLDFGAARQQSFDALGTDWAFVIDADDEWTGGENFRHILDKADSSGAVMVTFPYHLEHVIFEQPRLYRRDAGRWANPIHEYFDLNDKRARAARTDLMTVSQKRGQAASRKALERNVTIAEMWLKANEPNARILTMLIQDSGHDSRRVLELCDRYAALPDKGTGNEQFNVSFLKGVALLNLERYGEALTTAFEALGQKNYGQAWTLAAEAALQLGRANPVYHELAIMYADKALACGRPNATYPYDPKHISSVPLHIQARSLFALGRFDESRRALDLAMMIDPDNAEIKALHGKLEATRYGKTSG